MKEQIRQLIYNLVFLPTCAGCDRRLAPVVKNNATYGKVCLCDDCLEKWQGCKAELCPECGQNLEKCNCIPAFLQKVQPDLPALCFYHGDDKMISDRIILKIKRSMHKELFSYLALELLPRLVSTLDKMDLAGEDCIFTWVPRKREHLKQYGFDQGKELCLQIAAGFGVKPSPLFARLNGKEQKKLAKSERKQNADRAILLRTSYKKERDCELIDNVYETVKGRAVVIVDDVITSGATMKRAAKLLQDAGALRVIVICVAKTKKNKSSSKSKSKNFR